MKEVAPTDMMQQSKYPGLGQIPAFGGAYMRSKGRNRKGEPISFKKVKVTTLCMRWEKLSSTLVVVASVHVATVATVAPVASITSVASVAHAIARVSDNRIEALITFPHV